MKVVTYVRRNLDVFHLSVIHSLLCRCERCLLSCDQNIPFYENFKLSVEDCKNIGTRYVALIVT